MADKLRQAFNSCKSDAKRRGVPFLLTFEEWLSIWRKSGKLSKRGKHRGQYQMARFGDRGPYKVSNVRILTVSENIIECNLGRRRWAKLTVSIVRRARKQYKSGRANSVQLAATYGVGEPTMWYALVGKTWRDA